MPRAMLDVAGSLLAWICRVRSRISLDCDRSCSFWCSSSCTVCHCWSAITWRFSSARFWLIITKVDRKMASNDTTIVSRPNG